MKVIEEAQGKFDRGKSLKSELTSIVDEIEKLQKRFSFLHNKRGVLKQHIFQEADAAKELLQIFS